MSCVQLRNVNFGKKVINAIGKIGYTLLDDEGNVVCARTTNGICELAPGIFSSKITFPDGFRGSILWDTGTALQSIEYAIEQYNIEENDPTIVQMMSNVNNDMQVIESKIDNLVDLSTQLYDIQYGRWKISNNQMIFYKEDNTTEIARFDLFDDSGNPAQDSVFDRRRI